MSSTLDIIYMTKRVSTATQAERDRPVFEITEDSLEAGSMALLMSQFGDPECDVSSRAAVLAVLSATLGDEFVLRP